MVKVEFHTHRESKFVEVNDLDKFLDFSLSIIKDEETEFNILDIFPSLEEFDSFEPWIGSTMDSWDILGLGFGYFDKEEEDESFDLYFTKVVKDENGGTIWLHLTTDKEVKNEDKRIPWADFHTQKNSDKVENNKVETNETKN